MLSLLSVTTLRYGEGLNQTFQLLIMIEKDSKRTIVELPC